MANLWIRRSRRLHMSVHAHIHTPVHTFIESNYLHVNDWWLEDIGPSRTGSWRGKYLTSRVEDEMAGGSQPPEHSLRSSNGKESSKRRCKKWIFTPTMPSQTDKKRMFSERWNQGWWFFFNAFIKGQENLLSNKSKLNLHIISFLASLTKTT